ncbi:hypothetical protein [Streptomyces sp. Ac-502]|uniref:hypothetical protein n=1 Tax=Streptomyces sp. Ac-502 TaxID=3342801 RepID=UPI003862AE22
MSARLLRGLPDGRTCPTCTRLEAAARDPRTEHPQCDLYGLLDHRLDDHHDTPQPLPGCSECRFWTATGREAPRIREDLRQRWAAKHFLCHALGIAAYIGLGYRYIDTMPPGARRVPHGH